MAIQFTQLFAPTVLTGSAATIYTMPTTPTTLALGNGKVRFTNTSNGAVAVTAYAIQAGGSAGAGNCFMNAESVAPNTHIDVNLPVLGPGGFFQAFGSSASDITVSQLSGTLFS